MGVMESWRTGVLKKALKNFRNFEEPLGSFSRQGVSRLRLETLGMEFGNRAEMSKAKKSGAVLVTVFIGFWIFARCY
jgi:hypothetical protein